MSDLKANPELLNALASRLRNTSADLESQATPPPDPQAGVITGAVQGAVALLTDAMGNLSGGITAVGNATAESRAVYSEVDYDEAAALQASELAAERPR